jgi:hypothetical protein
MRPKLAMHPARERRIAGRRQAACAASPRPGCAGVCTTCACSSRRRHHTLLSPLPGPGNQSRESCLVGVPRRPAGPGQPIYRSPESSPPTHPPTCVDPGVAFVKQRGAVPARNPEQQRHATRVESQVGSHVVHFAAEHSPCVGLGAVPRYLLQCDVAPRRLPIQACRGSREWIVGDCPLSMA